MNYFVALEAGEGFDFGNGDGYDISLGVNFIYSQNLTFDIK